MFVPNLDEGSSWQSVARGSSPQGLFGYLFRADLNFRADAVLVSVEMADTTRQWAIAGNLIQLWEQNGISYQTKYKVIRLDNKTIIPVEPVANSTLIFNPVDWLSNWTIDIKARAYQPSVLGEIDFSSLEERLDSLLSELRLDFAIINTNAVDAFNSSTTQRIDMLQQIGRLEEGVYTLAEGIADLLPGSQGEELRQRTQNRLDSDLGFL